MIDSLLERNVLPDVLIRLGIRNLLAKRLRDEDLGNIERNQEKMMAFIESLKASPVAIHTKEANEQHYEVPTEFYQLVLGKNLKYSSGYWKQGVTNFDQSEEDMLDITVTRAEISDGMRILELGCGWGSLSMYMAKRFPKAQITAVSNSRTQKLFIDEACKQRGITNLTIITADMNEFSINETFDRIVSVEMLEHMRNYQIIFERVSTWLKNEGKFFVHIFTHKDFAYPFDVKDSTDWMAKYFFTGGIMPSDHLFFYFQDHLSIKKHWRVSGTHYSKTSEAWLENMDAHKSRIMPLFAATYGEENKVKWWVYWRVFFMACAELWGYKNGEEWLVSHYLFEKKK